MFNRTQQPPTANRQISQTKIFPAPSRGWIRNENLSSSKGGGCEVLDNFFPTPEGGRMRKGSVLHATIDAAVTHLTTYRSGAVLKMFASDADAVYDVTNPAVPATEVLPDFLGQTNGNYCSFQVATTGGDFLMLFNGADSLQIFNGSVWGPVAGAVVNQVAYDTGTVAFVIGETLTGGTSGATATILNKFGTTAAGTLVLGPITGGPYVNNETLTGSGGGSALANGGSASLYAAITGVSTADISFGWVWKSFVWMIEEGTLDAWYLASGTIGGAASVFPLNGVFKHGGSLLFGATWSQDSGAGLDDVCLFVTDQGEIAVYEGTEPADPETFALVGVYKIGKPLGKNSFFRSGGDIAVVTDDGITPVSMAVNQDRTGVKASALTYPIEEAWRLIVRERSGTARDFIPVLWPSETMLVVGVPTLSGQDPICLVANARTGAWCRYVGWDTSYVVEFDDELFFGTPDGTVVQGETTGADQGVNYTGVWVPQFETFKSAEEKQANHARIVARANNSFTPQLFAQADYEPDIPTPLPADSAEGDSLWDTGVWDTSTWGAGADRKAKFSEWQSVGANGQALAPGLQITMGRTAAPDLELIALHLQFEQCEVMS